MVNGQSLGPIPCTHWYRPSASSSFSHLPEQGTAGRGLWLVHPSYSSGGYSKSANSCDFIESLTLFTFCVEALVSGARWESQLSFSHNSKFLVFMVAEKILGCTLFMLLLVQKPEVRENEPKMHYFQVSLMLLGCLVHDCWMLGMVNDNIPLMAQPTRYSLLRPVPKARSIPNISRTMGQRLKSTPYPYTGPSQGHWDGTCYLHTLRWSSAERCSKPIMQTSPSYTSSAR